MRRLTHRLASWHDEEELVAEISAYDGEDVANVIRREDRFELTMYRRPDQSDLVIDASGLGDIFWRCGQ